MNRDSGTFTYPVHSGFGNQVQELLPALFLAHATGRTAVLPPLLPYSTDISRGVEEAVLLSRLTFLAFQ